MSTQTDFVVVIPIEATTDLAALAREHLDRSRARDLECGEVRAARDFLFAIATSKHLCGFCNADVPARAWSASVANGDPVRFRAVVEPFLAEAMRRWGLGDAALIVIRQLEAGVTSLVQIAP